MTDNLVSLALVHKSDVSGMLKIVGRIGLSTADTVDFDILVVLAVDGDEDRTDFGLTPAEVELVEWDEDRTDFG